MLHREVHRRIRAAADGFLCGQRRRGVYLAHRHRCPFEELQRTCVFFPTERDLWRAFLFSCCRMSTSYVVALHRITYSIDTLKVALPRLGLG